MRIIDLTRTITEDMPVYPGTDQPVLEVACTKETDGFEERRLTMFSHTGTHVDAPAHLLQDGPSLGSLAAERFVGPACVLDLRDAGPEVSRAAIKAHAPDLERTRFALLRTGWDRYWGTPRYFEGYPVLSVSAAKWLANFELKGIGLDCISPDPVGAAGYEVHRVFLERGMVIVENLTHLEQVPQGALFSALPLKIARGDGSPVRAVAMVRE